MKEIVPNQKPENDLCPGCHRIRLACVCGGGDEESDIDKDKDVTYTSKQGFSPSVQAAITTTQKFELKIWVLPELFSKKTINCEVELLFLDSNESDQLGAKLIFRIKQGLSSDEIKILKMIETEFDHFKNQLTQQGILTKNFTAVFNENELVIHMPISSIDAFIKHLENKNLITIQNPEPQNKEEREFTFGYFSFFQPAKPQAQINNLPEEIPTKEISQPLTIPHQEDEFQFQMTR
jgi:hypothetical protein